MQNTQKAPNPSGTNLKTIGHFLKDAPRQPLSIATSIMLGTTALATPVLGSMIGTGLLTAASIYLLTQTSDVVVNNATALGKKIGISPLLLGVGLGVITSMPELAVSAGAVLQGQASLGIGNIVGSNIANLLLVLGITATIKPIKTTGLSWKFNTAVMCGATALFGAQLVAGSLNPLMGITMIGALGAYIYGSLKTQKIDAEKTANDKTKQKKDFNRASTTTEEELPEQKLPTWFNGVMGVAGIAGLVASADVLVSSASTLALGIGINPALVGAIGIAIGTSLPELMVNVKSALKGDTEMAIGNILGSNIFNVLMVGSVLAFASTTVPLSFGLGSALGIINLTALGASAALATGALFAGKGKLKRAHGVVALSLYGAFTAASALFSGNAPETPKIEHGAEKNITILNTKAPKPPSMATLKAQTK